jgi:hypothetical protein
MLESDGQGRFYIKSFGDCAQVTGYSEDGLFGSYALEQTFTTLSRRLMLTGTDIQT